MVCFKLFKFNKIQVGDFVVFSQKPHGLMIKRVEQIEGERYYVQGSDPMSVDSRNFGPITRSDIRYKKFSFGF